MTRRKGLRLSKSGIKIRNKLGFQVRDPVLDLEFPLLHPRDPELVHGGIGGQARNRLVQVTVLLSQFGQEIGDFARMIRIKFHDLRIVRFGPDLI